MRVRSELAAVLGAALIPSGAGAQLVLDGSLGPAGQIAPNAANELQITDEQGVFSANGANRFHSFSQFNLLDPNQPAVFSSLQSPERVIVRVMQRAQIDAALRSDIPNADLYFLSPFGISFGPNASLDVRGSFHASSADVLRFPDVAADLPTGSSAVPAVLSSAPPVAFGFTGASPGSISITRSDFVFGDSLSVPLGETLSFVGGEFRAQSFSGTNVEAPGATVQIAAVAGPAEVPVALAALDPASLPAPPAACPGAGCITLSNNAEIDLSSPVDGSARAGRIVIRGGRFRMLSRSAIRAVERGGPGLVPGGGIDIGVNGAIELTGGSLIESASESGLPGADIGLDAPLVAIDGAVVESDARAAGAGGAIEVRAQTLRVSNTSQHPDGGFIASVAGEGLGGDLTVRAKNIELLDGGQLRADTVGAGDAGRLQVIGAETVRLDGVDAFARRSSMTARSLETATGDARDLSVDTGILEVVDGAQISAATFGTGNSGAISIEASESVTIRDGSAGFTSLVSTAAVQPGSTSVPLGQSGDLRITSRQVTLADGGRATVSTDGALPAGNLSIRADSVSIAGVGPTVGESSGLSAQSNPSIGGGAGGDISVETTGDITVRDGGSVSVQTRGTGNAGAIRLDAGGSIRVMGGTVSATSSGSGAGGSIGVSADRGVAVTDGGAITAQALSAGNAGDIDIDAGPRLEVVNASITTESQNASGGSIDIEARDAVVLSNAQITTSVQGGTGGGGDIAIDPEFVILDRSRIVAQAFEGAGGNIRIRAGTLLATPDSLIDASSQLGIDGNVSIDSPNPELTGKLAVLPQAFLNASELLADPCLARTATEGSFVVGAPRTAAPPDAVLAPESGAPAACAPPEETP